MSNKLSRYEKLSFRRKELQKQGLAPEWMTTAGYQLLVNKSYLLPGEEPRDMYLRVANRAAKLTEKKPLSPKDYGYEHWDQAFFDILWKGWLSPSTPVLSNFGTNRGHPVSCSGSMIEDSIYSFYDTRKELAKLTQRGYGTSVCLDPIRPRGSAISTGAKASGIMPVARGIVQDMRDVAQGTRRGSCGIYLNVLHDDFDELADQIIADDDGWNIGWNIDQEFVDLFNKDPEEADRRWKRLLKVKRTKGKGYFEFLHKINKDLPQMYKDRGWKVSHSNLCNEIQLYDDKDHSFTCVLTSVNVAKYDEWKDTDLYDIAYIFLDAVIDDMLEKARKEPGFEKVIRFTENTRAVGLGVLGFATYLQEHNMAFGDLQSTTFNHLFFKNMRTNADRISKELAEKLGEPEYLKGYGERFSHKIAIPPTMSTSLIMGNISQGIEPIYADIYTLDSAGGTVYIINPSLIKLMKERGVYTKDVMKRINDNFGSVQNEDWLSDEEKLVFRTAFEINQDDVLRLASDRQKYIDQGQSLNLYLHAGYTEEEVSRLHVKALMDPYIKGLYYVRTLDEAINVEPVCLACEG
jgi:ribonucleoside-diphosphate reductase alpha chain